MLEESEDSGFAYYTRFFRCRGDAVPEVKTNLLTHVGSFSILTLPGDRKTWSITLYASAGDAPLKAFRHPDRWENVVRACPLHAHWLDGEPISDMTIMAGVLDRRRRLTNEGTTRGDWDRPRRRLVGLHESLAGPRPRTWTGPCRPTPGHRA